MVSDSSRRVSKKKRVAVNYRALIDKDLPILHGWSKKTPVEGHSFFTAYTFTISREE